MTLRILIVDDHRLFLSGEPKYRFFTSDEERTVVQPIKELDELFVKMKDDVRLINPAVWNASTKLLRFAALFRYFKGRSPIQWGQFVAQIQGRRMSPVVTPSVAYYGDHEGKSGDEK